MTIKYKCRNCNKKFNKKINYEKHINRRIPCHVEEYYKCEKCGKEFDKIFNYEQHLKRKTPCTPKIENNPALKPKETKQNIQLELEKTKLKQEEEKTKREIEKNKLEIEKLKLKIELKKIESENRKEEIGLRKEKNIEIETMKEKRKEKTSTIINNNYTQNNYIEATNYINNNFNPKIVYESKGFKNKEIEHLYNSLQDPKFVRELYVKSNDLNELLVNVIKYSYNNDNYPEKRYFIYDNNSNNFFEIDKNSGKYKIVKFDEIDKYIKKATGSSYNQVKLFLKNNASINSKDHNIKLYENIYAHGNKPLKDPAMIGLDPNNRIVRSIDQGANFVKTSNKKTNKYDNHFSDSSDEDLYD